MDINPKLKTQNNVTSKIPESWDDSDLGDFKYHPEKKQGMSFSLKFFLISLGIFLLVGAFVLYSLFSNNSAFSVNNINFDMSGSASLPSGEPGSLNLKIENKNKTPISDAYVIIQYDSGENVSGAKNVVSQKIEVGQILANDFADESASVVLFGNEGTNIQISATFFYKINGSNAEFNKPANPISITLKSSPIILTVESLKEFHQNNNYNLNLKIKNNTPKDISNIIVSVRPPNDFVYASSSQARYNNNPSWLIQNLPAKSEKQISFSGKLTGDIGATDQFTFYAGTPNSISTTSSSTIGNYDNFNLNLDNIYSQVQKNILISGQYLDLSLTDDSANGSQTVSPSDLIMLDFTYKNNLNYPIDNLVITAKLSGDGIDTNYTQAVEGVYDGATNIATWDKSTISGFSQIGANATGKIRLKIRVVKNLIGDNNIHLQLFAHGERKSEVDVSNDQNMSFERSWSVKNN